MTEQGVNKKEKEDRVWTCFIPSAVPDEILFCCYQDSKSCPEFYFLGFSGFFLSKLSSYLLISSKKLFFFLHWLGWASVPYNKRNLNNTKVSLKMSQDITGWKPDLLIINLEAFLPCHATSKYWTRENVLQTWER